VAARKAAITEPFVQLPAVITVILTCYVSVQS